MLHNLNVILGLHCKLHGDPSISNPITWTFDLVRDTFFPWSLKLSFPISRHLKSLKNILKMTHQATANSSHYFYVWCSFCLLCLPSLDVLASLCVSVRIPCVKIMTTYSVVTWWVSISQVRVKTSHSKVIPKFSELQQRLGMGRKIEKEQDMCTINDPLGQTHSPASSDHYYRLKFVFVLQDFEKWGRTDGQHFQI